MSRTISSSGIGHRKRIPVLVSSLIIERQHSPSRGNHGVAVRQLGGGEQKLTRPRERSFEQHGPGKFRDATHVAKQSSNCVSDKKKGVQSEEIKRDPEMDKSAVWAGSGCMAVFLFPGHV